MTRVIHPNSIQIGPKNGMWKGGSFITNDGYRRILKPDHPRANHKGYVLEHILVLEQKLGRPLLPNEDCHHINGNKLDNRPENLINLIHGQHTILTNKKDLSNRKCMVCGSNETYVDRKGWARWYKTENGQFLCDIHYKALKRSK